jgi:transitional endoplasmic reticulum ATPase
MEKIILRVAEAPSNLVGRGIAIIDQKIIREQEWQSGDIIEINGTRKAFAKVWPAQSSEYGKGLIRIDASIRNNAGVGIDDRVTIKKTEAKIAESLTLYPTEPLRIMGGEKYLAQLLEGRVVSPGSIIGINIMGRRVDLIVSGHKPKAEAVIISIDTIIQFTDRKPRNTSTIPKVSY